ncbi:MAG: glycosyltransferase family 2 protein, partial [Bacteroidota bacterium]
MNETQSQKQKPPLKVSVIVPNFNRAELLPETLDNILGQSLPPYELIVVDDRSTDNFAEVKERYKDRVIFVVNKGRGPGAGRNTGFEISTGEYVKYFDSDDVMTVNSLEAQAGLLNKTGQPMVYGPYVHVTKDADNRWKQAGAILQYKGIPDAMPLRRCMVRGFFTAIAAMTFRRDFMQDIGPWRTDIFAYEDWDLLWRIGRTLIQPLHNSETAMFYRMHGAQITGSQVANQTRNFDRVACFTDALNSLNPATDGTNNWDKQVMKAQIWRT